MQKKFVSNLLFVILLNLLVKPFWILGIEVTVQNRVGELEYGMYYPLFGFAILFNIILDFGITGYNNRNIAQHKHMLSRYFSGIFNVKLFLAAIYFLVTIAMAVLFGYEGRAFRLLGFLCFNQFLSSMILYLRSNLAGLHLFKLDGLFSILDRVLMIAICGILLWHPNFGKNFRIEWLVYAQLVSYAITAVIAFIVVFTKADFFKPKINFSIFRIILRESFPYALLVLLMSFYYRLDSVMIERLIPNGQYEAGIYAKAYRLLEGFNMFGYLFAGILLPMFARMIKQNESIAKLVKLSFNLIFVPTIAVAIVSYYHGYEIMDLLYIENVDESASVYSVLMFSFIAIALTYVYGTLLTANGSLKHLNIISLVGLLINLILNFILIPKKGAYGAAVATLFTQFVVVIAQLFACRSIIKSPFSLMQFAKYLLITIIGVAMSYLFENIGLSWYWSSLCILTVFPILAVIFRLFKLKEMFQLLGMTKV